MKLSRSLHSGKTSPRFLHIYTHTIQRLLILEFVATAAPGEKVENAIARKKRRRLPMPLCCWKFRPTKVYFLHTIKWSVMQCIIFRPLVSIAGIVTDTFGLYCENGGFDPHFAYVYLEVVGIISVTYVFHGSYPRNDLDQLSVKNYFIWIKFISKPHKKRSCGRNDQARSSRPLISS